MADYPYNTARWQRLRASHLRLSPLCIGCEAMGLVRTANTVDHVTAISVGGPAFPTHDGLASYCAACHSAKTARSTEAGAAKTQRPRKGCDVHGNPLDQRHPWHAVNKSLRADTGKTEVGHENSISSASALIRGRG